MSELLGRLQDRTFLRATAATLALVPSDVLAAASGDWVSAWIRLTADRLMSYGAERTRI